MQRGTATIEIVLAITILAILAGSALPNVARLIDRAALDYETKRLYSELRFTQSMSKVDGVLSTGTGNASIASSGDIMTTLIIAPDKKSYQVFRGVGSDRKALRAAHHFSYGVTLSFKSSVAQSGINFDEFGRSNVTSNSLVLTSRLKKNNYIVFDSVGRIRASLTGN